MSAEPLDSPNSVEEPEPNPDRRVAGQRWLHGAAFVAVAAALLAESPPPSYQDLYSDTLAGPQITLSSEASEVTVRFRGEYHDAESLALFSDYSYLDVRLQGTIESAGSEGLDAGADAGLGSQADSVPGFSWVDVELSATSERDGPVSVGVSGLRTFELYLSFRMDPSCEPTGGEEGAEPVCVQNFDVQFSLPEPHSAVGDVHMVWSAEVSARGPRIDGDWDSGSTYSLPWDATWEVQ